MTGGWQWYIRRWEKDMSGRAKDGFPTEEESIIAMTADTISGHKTVGESIALSGLTPAQIAARTDATEPFAQACL